MRMRHGVAAILVLSAGLVSARAADMPKDLIVGKWQPVAEKGKDYQFEFNRDGTLKVSDKSGNKELTYEGKYKFLKDNLVEITLLITDPDAKQTVTKTQKVTIVRISKEEMITSDEMNREESFKRLK